MENSDNMEEEIGSIFMELTAVTVKKNNELLKDAIASIREEE